jgi:hypothetical protein
MRGIPLLWVGVAATLAMGEVRAGADTIKGSYDDQLQERSHRVRVTRKNRIAHFEVTRVFANRARRVDELMLHITLPSGAVATGLRLRQGGRWIRGKLMASKAAGALYDKLTTKGPVRSKGPALLAWESRGTLVLRVFPIPAGGSVKVEYTLEAPLCYRNGWELTDYRYSDDDDVKPRLTASGARVLANPKKLEALLGATFSDACSGIGTMLEDDVRRIAFPSKRTAPITVRYGRHRAGKKSLARIEIDAPVQFMAKPRNARVVFVLDASISQGAAGMRAQLDQVRGYLRRLPDARVEIVLYQRYGQRLFGRFVPAKQVPAALARAASRLALGNGSHLERGLAVASQLLARGKGPARIIAFTDSKFRTAFKASMGRVALQSFPRRGVAHLVDVGLGSANYQIERKSDHLLTGVIEAAGGMVVELSGTAGGTGAAYQAMHELVVPLRIHDFAITGKGAGELVNTFDTNLYRGDGLRSFALLDGAPDRLVVTGKLWGRAIKRVARPDARSSRALPALAFGHSLSDKLSAGVALALATRGQVVSPVTSFLARDSRVPSSSWNYDMGIGMSATCGCMSGLRSIGIGCGGVRGTRGFGVGHGIEDIDPAAVLADLLEGGVNGCAMTHGVSTFDVRVGVETTGVEIVDVSVKGTANRALAACIADTAWAVRLPKLFTTKKRYEARLSWPRRR